MYLIFFVFIIGYSFGKVYGENLRIGFNASQVSGLCFQNFQAVSSSVGWYTISIFFAFFLQTKNNNFINNITLIYFNAILFYLIFFVFIVECSLNRVYGEHPWMAVVASQVLDLCFESFLEVGSYAEWYIINFDGICL